MSKSAEKQWLSVADLQAWLSLGRSKTYELLNDPDGIPGYRIGRVIRVRRQDVEKWLENNRYRPGH